MNADAFIFQDLAGNGSLVRPNAQTAVCDEVKAGPEVMGHLRMKNGADRRHGGDKVRRLALDQPLQLQVDPLIALPTPFIHSLLLSHGEKIEAAKSAGTPPAFPWHAGFFFNVIGVVATRAPRNQARRHP
jgi:hypothetical protein